MEMTNAHYNSPHQTSQAIQEHQITQTQTRIFVYNLRNL